MALKCGCGLIGILGGTIVVLIAGALSGEPFLRDTFGLLIFAPTVLSVGGFLGSLAGTLLVIHRKRSGSR